MKLVIIRICCTLVGIVIMAGCVRSTSSTIAPVLMPQPQLPDLTIESAGTSNPTEVIIKNIGTAVVTAEMFWVCSFMTTQPYQCYKVRDVKNPGDQSVLNFDATPTSTFNVIVDKGFPDDPGLVTELRENNNQIKVQRLQ
jgi:hypothetical protein